MLQQLLVYPHEKQNRPVYLIYYNQKLCESEIFSHNNYFVTIVYILRESGYIGVFEQESSTAQLFDILYIRVINDSRIQ